MDFYPKTIHAGTNDTLTIIGSNFGDQGVVKFLDAKGFFYCESYFDPYIVSWNSNKIEVIVPGIAVPGIYVPASGYFKIVRTSPSLSGEVYSPETLNVDYCLLNKNKESASSGDVLGFYAHGYLSKTHCDGITYSLHTNLELYESTIVVTLDSIFKEISDTLGASEK